MFGFYSGKKPSLVSSNLDKKLTGYLEKHKMAPVIQSGGVMTQAKEWASILYDQYLRPNIFPLILFIIVSVVLYYRYQMDEPEPEGFERYVQQYRQQQPTMNPSLPISRQVNHARESSVRVPVNYDGRVRNDLRFANLPNMDEVLSATPIAPSLTGYNGTNQHGYQLSNPRNTETYWSSGGSGWTDGIIPLDRPISSFGSQMEGSNFDTYLKYQQLHEREKKRLQFNNGPEYLDKVTLVPPYDE